MRFKLIKNIDRASIEKNLYSSEQSLLFSSLYCGDQSAFNQVVSNVGKHNDGISFLNDFLRPALIISPDLKFEKVSLSEVDWLAKHYFIGGDWNLGLIIPDIFLFRSHHSPPIIGTSIFSANHRFIRLYASALDVAVVMRRANMIATLIKRIPTYYPRGFGGDESQRFTPWRVETSSQQIIFFAFDLAMKMGHADEALDNSSERSRGHRGRKLFLGCAYCFRFQQNIRRKGGKDGSNFYDTIFDAEENN